MDTKKLTRLSMLLAISLVLSLIESFIPFIDGSIPGLKLGLANVIVLTVLYVYDFKDAIYISILRVFIMGLLRTGIFSITFFFSLAGAIFSIVAMYLMKKFTKLSVIGVSVVGSLFHSVGQLLIAIIFLRNVNMIYYLLWLLLFSIPTGIIVGLISKELIKHLKK